MSRLGNLRNFLFAIGFAVVLGLPAMTAAQTVTEFPLPNGNGNPDGITPGPDGALWFTEEGAVDIRGNIQGPGKIGRITTDGAITEYAVPSATSYPKGIAAGPDGALWFTEFAGNQIGRITTAGEITEFPLPAVNSEPSGITSGPDGALWFTEVGGSKIGRITTAGSITEYSTPTSNSRPYGITAGPDAALWFTESRVNSQIGRITTSGAVTEFTGTDLTVSASENNIVVGPDNNLWFATSCDQIGQVTTNGVVTLFPAIDVGCPLMAGSHAQSITTIGGLLWLYVAGPFGMGSSIAGTTTAGTSSAVNVISLPKHYARVVTAGPDGALWFTINDNIIGISDSAIGRATLPPANTLSVLAGGAGSGTVTSNPAGIVCNPTSNQCSSMYTPGVSVTLTASANAGSVFAGWSGGGCSGIDPCTITLNADTTVTANFVQQVNTNIALFAAILPLSRSVEVGATATAFATIVNSGPGDATTCSIAPAATIPASFAFRTTDPTTNLPNGTLNTPADISQGQAQTFVIGLTPTAAFAPTDVGFAFGCANAAPVATLIGVNTLNLSASTLPVPDIVALAASADPGFVDIPGPTGAGAFAVATSNVGAAASITATADTGGINLPLTLTVCETNPISGFCTAPSASSVTTTINGGETPTFGIFAVAGSTIADSPGVNRVFVRFRDNGGTLRGETSVAVRTQ
jgi:virginiamycin B lyase